MRAGWPDGAFRADKNSDSSALTKRFFGPLMTIRAALANVPAFPAKGEVPLNWAAK